MFNFDVSFAIEEMHSHFSISYDRVCTCLLQIVISNYENITIHFLSVFHENYHLSSLFKCLALQLISHNA